MLIHYHADFLISARTTVLSACFSSLIMLIHYHADFLISEHVNALPFRLRVIKISSLHANCQLPSTQPGYQHVTTFACRPSTQQGYQRVTAFACRLYALVLAVHTQTIRVINILSSHTDLTLSSRNDNILAPHENYKHSFAQCELDCKNSKVLVNFESCKPSQTLYSARISLHTRLVPSCSVRCH